MGGAAYDVPEGLGRNSPRRVEGGGMRTHDLSLRRARATEMRADPERARTRSDPVFAAVIPTYQREATIGRAVESVLSQTRPPSEVIVVDDGSTDRTHTRLEAFGDSIRVVAQAQSGSAAARNRGVESASGEWIAFLDSDDSWRPDHLERIGEAIVSTSGQGDLYFRDTQMASATFEGDEPGARVGSLWELAGFHPAGPVTLVDDGSVWVLLRVQPMMVQSSVVRRERYLELGGMRPDLRLRHDTHLFFRLGLGRPICAVAGIGTAMTDDAGDGRLTRDVAPTTRSYWEDTVVLYDDLAGQSPRGSEARRTFDERLASAYWRLARIGLAERSVGATIGPFIASLRTQPSFIPRAAVARLKRH